MFRYILFGVVLVLGGATMVFMILNYLFDVSIVLSNPKIGMELLANKITIMGLIISIILIFWFLINYLANKTKRIK
ncbi:MULTISPECIES: hypothetical protein [Bacillus]|uniref:Uncharacterized protein n=1 Tax=Bacillus fungorum TaxID=2039284 RepID=A0A2G6Q7H3_9BACI|nr:hypothetical protein [Bacillus fungorum]PIE92784.1 hypothetical protein CO726_24775 [Bacillus fungorum]